jgi:hypothetical protein
VRRTRSGELAAPTLPPPPAELERLRAFEAAAREQGEAAARLENLFRVALSGSDAGAMVTT